MCFAFWEKENILGQYDKPDCSQNMFLVQTETSIGDTPIRKLPHATMCIASNTASTPLHQSTMWRHMFFVKQKRPSCENTNQHREAIKQK
jgi:hypothetical protein